MPVRPMLAQARAAAARVRPARALQLPSTAVRRRPFATSVGRRAQEAVKAEHEEPYRPFGRSLRLEGQAIVTDDPTKPRINPVGIQLLSKSFHEQVFPGASGKSPDIIAVETSIAHLQSNDLLRSAPPVQPTIDFPLPPLMGKNLDEHFHNMGLHEAEPYLSMAEKFAATPPIPLPARFSHASGWTRYDPLTGEATAVPYPDESMVTFDVEVLYKINPYPIMAAAMSPTHWYTWLSPWLLGDSAQQEHLCPLGPADAARIVVGHNVGYDRIRIKEEYSLGGSKNRFLDTMSFHSASQGVSAPQRGAWLAHKKQLAEAERLRVQRLEELEAEAETLRERLAAGEVEEVVERAEEVTGEDYDYSEGGMFPEVSDRTVRVVVNLAERLRKVEADLVDIPLPVAQANPGKRFLALNVFGEKTEAEPAYEEASDEDIASADRIIRTWEDLTAMSSLEEVFKLHFPSETINKTTRNAFAAEDRSFILEDLQNLIHYCASDVHATHRVYSRTLPRYRRLCPSPASFAGMLVMGSAFLPVNHSWDRYVKASEEKFLELDGGVRQKLASLAETARERWTAPAADFKADTKDPDLMARLACPDEVKDDPWLSQLDWTPKKARHFKWATLPSMSRATGPSVEGDGNGGGSGGGGGAKSGGVLPKSRTELNRSKVIPNSISLCYRGCPVVWSVEHGWVYRRDPSLPAAAATAPETDAVQFNDERDAFLGSQTKGADRKKRVTFHQLPNPTKSTKLTGCLGKAFLKKSGADLSCQDDELLQMIIAEADWQEIEDRLRDHLERNGQLSGLQAEERTSDTPAERSRAESGSPAAGSTTAAAAAPSGPSQVVLPESFVDLAKDKAMPVAIGLRYDGHEVVFSHEHGWCCKYDRAAPPADGAVPPDSLAVALKDPRDRHLLPRPAAAGDRLTVSYHQLPNPAKADKVTRCLGKVFVKKFQDQLSCDDDQLLFEVALGTDWKTAVDRLEKLLASKGALKRPAPAESKPAAIKVETPAIDDDAHAGSSPSSEPLVEVERDYMTASPSARQALWWPQWYHDLFAPNVNRAWDQMNFSVRNTVATLLLQLSWRGYPLFKSRQYGWVFRMPREAADAEDEDRSRRLFFPEGQAARAEKGQQDALVAEGAKRAPAASAAKKVNPDVALHLASMAGDCAFFQVPHPNGEGQNVGYMTSKPFIKFIEDETLSSVYPLAKEAMQMNVACSYWISVRERVVEQLAIRQSAAMPMGFPTSPAAADGAPSPPPSDPSPPPPPGSSLAVGASDNDEGYGVILPQVIVMGTITRRAIEKTWLTASNAKKNRVGSELKAMIQAPAGYSIVGADVDSEELWIASLLGDAQLGMHGASAIGWMTLEGTKGAGTDVHSKTASIVNITRDMAKVFNYSRIYGAGVKNATRLLLDGMKEPDVEHAEAAAKLLYLSTKGDRVPRKSREFHSFWFGGSESYLFNSIEQVARSKRPTTPALGCGVTAALREEFLTNKEDHMTSRINWVVQSSGVDYLHLLIVAVNRLCTLYDIDARYLISVHDEVRYLVKNEDRYRLALALQVANMWTRALFAFKLGMEDLPQGCAFFSEVDVDYVLRKEVSMPCITPSNPDAIAPGEALSIQGVLEKTGASLFRDGAPSSDLVLPPLPSSTDADGRDLFPRRPYYDPRAAAAAAAAAEEAALPAALTLASVRADPTQMPRWRRFFLQAQALKAEADIKDAWEHYGRPPDPVRAHRQRQSGPQANPWQRHAKPYNTGVGGGKKKGGGTEKASSTPAKVKIERKAAGNGAAPGPPPMVRPRKA